MIPVYVNDIKKSLKNKSYFSALALSLALPDMCGMAEFPNKGVSERYIGWYDKYPGKYMAQGKENGGVPYLSGEVIYNLRNTFLHQGMPDIARKKIKEVTNKIDNFMLVLGDGKQIWESSFNIDVGDGKFIFKSILVDVTFLCNKICDCALWYYENNKSKFEFKCNIITQEEFERPQESF